MAAVTELDAHEQPPPEVRAKWKAYSKANLKDLLQSCVIDDPLDTDRPVGFFLAGTVAKDRVLQSYQALCCSKPPDLLTAREAPVYHHPLLPGLSIVPAVIPPEVQKTLLRNLIHRDLSDAAHQTNMHLHFSLPYPKSSRDGLSSFFSYPPTSTVMFEPKDSFVHRPLSVKQVLEQKLHWMTLGGQYDWTNRVYPAGRPPDFPPDIAGFLRMLFPETLAQAAIVNLYTPGDTMTMHRDVSEETDKGLVSLSLGCDALFMISPNDTGKKSPNAHGGKDHLLLRLRSGDAVYMTKESRFAWHGVPKVLKGTCPPYLEDWPAEDGEYEEWRGWMRNKRINLNVRQMRD